jgi:hypothetical protein
LVTGHKQGTVAFPLRRPLLRSAAQFTVGICRFSLTEGTNLCAVTSRRALIVTGIVTGVQGVSSQKLGTISSNVEQAVFSAVHI